MGWFSSKFSSYYVYSWGGFGVEKTHTPRRDVIGYKYVHPVTFIRGVFFAQIYIMLRLFVGWFSIKLTSSYVCSWGGSRTSLHPITYIHGVVSEWKKHTHTHTPRRDVIGCKYVHPVTFIRGVFFVQICILLRLFVDWFSIKFRSYVYSGGGF